MFGAEENRQGPSITKKSEHFGNRLETHQHITSQSKVLDKVVCAQLTEYLANNDIMPDVKSSLRRTRDKTTALLDVSDSTRCFGCCHVHSSCSARLFTSLWLFDTITVRWFRGYLDNRRQFVQMRRADGSKMASNCRCINVEEYPKVQFLGRCYLFCIELT